MAGPRQRMLVPSIADRESKHLREIPHRRQAQALDHAAMLELHEWLERRRFWLFGGLWPCDQKDAVAETFVRTVEFAEKMRDPGALYGACVTIGLRIRARRMREYINENLDKSLRADRAHSWHPERHLVERERRRSVLAAIRSLPAPDREIIRRFYLEEQTREQIQDEMQLTHTQFRLRKSRAVSRVGLLARAMLAS